MNTKWKYQKNGYRGDVLKFLMDRPSLTVIDVGAASAPWSHNSITASLDTFNIDVPGVHNFIGNILYDSGWKDVEDWCLKNGKFDFSICSHTLEDVSNCIYLARKLEGISKRGVIITPSKYAELSRNQDGPYRGYTHHRWILNMDGDVIVAYPKLNLIEFFDFSFVEHGACDENKELIVWWDEDIKIRSFDDLFLETYNLITFDDEYNKLNATEDFKFYRLG